MNVKLVSLTKSMITEKDLSAEELITYIARVSNPSNQLNSETSDKLLGYCIKNKHWSPFDMVNMTVEVTTSKAIGIQILRHWSIKPQEFSQRYAKAAEIEPINLRLAAATNRQSSSQSIGDVTFGANGGFGINIEEGMDDKFAMESLLVRVGAHVTEANKLYNDLITAGIAKECARMVLPMATSTTLYLNGSVRSWIHYMEQRCDHHAQLEHRLVADEVKKIFMENFPNISKALEL